MSGTAATKSAQQTVSLSPRVQVTKKVLESVNCLRDALGNSSFLSLFNPKDQSGRAIALITQQGMGSHFEILRKALSGKGLENHRQELEAIWQIISNPGNKEKISEEHRSGFMRLLAEIGAGEQISEEAAKLQTSANDLMDGALTKISDILARELGNTGSVPGMLARIPGILPKEITNADERKKYIEEKLLNEDFRNCMQGYLKGEQVNLDNLESAQRTTFKGFKGAMWMLNYTPKALLEYLPAVGTGLGFIAKSVPCYGIINMILMFLGTYQKELHDMKDLMEKFHQRVPRSLDQETKEAVNAVVEEATNEMSKKTGITLHKGRE